MVFLALDTSAGTSVALVDENARIVCEHAVHDTMKHAEVVGSLIARCLDDVAVTPRDIEAVVVGVGPGPFTGLRVGMAAGRLFACARDISVLPVISHDAIAARAYESGECDAKESLLVVTDARRREQYWSFYAGCEETRGVCLPLRQRGPGLAKPDAVPSLAGARIDARSVSAAALGRIAVARRMAGLPADADEALYLRAPDVTVAHPNRRVS